MDKKLDVAKVDAALKRAARTAVTGSRDARSGRFTVSGNTIASDKRPSRAGSAGKNAMRPSGKWKSSRDT
ncbi:MAG: hypothetical protein VX871_01550 [Pseudomonadota bacterium]|nr:hypothetical protein [Pseudomonadota bacterium]